MVRGVVFPSAAADSGAGSGIRPAPSPLSSSAPNDIIEKRRNKFGMADLDSSDAQYRGRGRGHHFRGRGTVRGSFRGRGRGRGRPRFANKTLIVNGGDGGGRGRPGPAAAVSKESLDQDLDSYFNQSDDAVKSHQGSTDHQQ